MAKNKLIKCKSCDAEIAASAKTCPHCGAKNKKPLYKKAWFWVLIVFLLIGFAGGGEEEASNPTDVQTVIAETPAEAAVAETQAPTVPAETEPSMTMGQKNALRSAKNYLSFSAFSYNGLIRQLEFEKYSTEDSTFAADNCGADWNEQALKSAKNYLDFSAFSYKGLIKQLEFEGFTNEQATYGADHCAADWNEQAVKSAKNYLDFSSFSRDGLIRQLEFEGFTHDEAVYGVEQNGF